MINVWLAVSPTLAAEFQSVGTSSTLPEAMQQQVMEQRGFDATLTSGLFNRPGGWALFTIYLEELGGWPDVLDALFPTDHRILGGWDVSTGEALLPQASDLADWIPDNTVRDVVLLVGQAPRIFSI